MTPLTEALIFFSCIIYLLKKLTEFINWITK